LSAVVLAMPPVLLGSADGPEPGHTGGFGEPTCHRCHFENSIDDSTGSLELVGIPDLYTPGSPYRLEITLQRPGLVRGGFQLAARFSSGPHQGQQAGRFERLDDRTQMPDPKGVQIQYVQHSKVGSYSSAVDGLTWTVRWFAPSESAAPVAFHLVGNASNDDDSEFGDFVYNKELVSRVAR
jgi:hypothetical protein